MIDVATVTLFLALLAVAAQSAVLTSLALAAASPVSARARSVLDEVRAAIAGRGTAIALLVAAVATAGSLYLSEVAHFLPCRLCWYQRAAMYPLVPLLAVAVARPGLRLWRLAVPVALVGGAVSTYHVAIERFPSLQVGGSCALDNPCTLRWVEELGYITIPVMALSAFALIVTVLVLDPSDPAEEIPVPTNAKTNKAGKPGRTTPSAKKQAGATSVRPGEATPTAGRRFPVWLVIAGVLFLAGVIAFALSATVDDPDTDVSSAESAAEYGTPTVTGETLPPFEGASDDAAAGMAAPAVSGEGFDGAPVAIDPDKGRAMALLFVAHWCPHCQAEVPVVTKWLEDGNLPDDVDMVAIATATDAARPNFPPSAWLAEEGWDQPVVVDGEQYEVGSAYGLTSFPFWVFVDADGKVVAHDSGELTPEQIDDHMAELTAG